VSDVGSYCIEVVYDCTAVPCSPFISKTYDASAIKCGPVPLAFVNKPVEFSGIYVTLIIIIDLYSAVKSYLQRCS